MLCFGGSEERLALKGVTRYPEYRGGSGSGSGSGPRALTAPSGSGLGRAGSAFLGLPREDAGGAAAPAAQRTRGQPAGLGPRGCRAVDRGGRLSGAASARPQAREGGARCDAGSGWATPLTARPAGWAEEDARPRLARPAAKPRVWICCAATHGLLLQTESECLDCVVEFTRAKYHPIKSEQDLNEEVSPLVSRGSWGGRSVRIKPVRYHTQ